MLELFVATSITQQPVCYSGLVPNHAASLDFDKALLVSPDSLLNLFVV